MSQSILVIGGTRYFGIRLVEALLAAGHRVTLATRGRAADPFGTRLRRLRVDRRDAAAMRAVFDQGARYDLVYDQMCYSPGDAAIAIDCFGGRVGRYLMTSTIETYEALHGRVLRPYREADLDLAAEPIDSALPWTDPVFAERHYGRGKRQAEALLARSGAGLPWASLRVAHVLGGPEDFTGRLRQHVELVWRGDAPLCHAAAAGLSSFIDVPGVVDVLLWAGGQDFRGPVNVAGEGLLSAPLLQQRIARRLGRPVLAQPQAAPGPLAFDYAAPHVMDTDRARALGWTFGHSDAWLDALIDAHAEELAREEHDHARA
ncbi:NAD-dependent epimerase/dehydratase family protein [Paucibacter sp. M5-1]|uniref:NAD-dependent epimerase/dehydratase family protein n=1 Tax=Paucibacter sp. M5-1 TaxID=3015998 RepID=UPI0022B8884E|nr:NAD-dependent epimerase/dehydratase family protein [Paucibacter sp. M5-1]MCZ7879804.1 NAD-dependent epimerase/dehydratase family protein [Paucibacter sp. M5-1]